jgi:hypothetical protein
LTKNSERKKVVTSVTRVTLGKLKAYMKAGRSVSYQRVMEDLKRTARKRGKVFLSWDTRSARGLLVGHTNWM